MFVIFEDTGKCVSVFFFVVVLVLFFLKKGLSVLSILAKLILMLPEEARR